jgi:CHAT domain-containing protein
VEGRLAGLAWAPYRLATAVKIVPESLPAAEGVTRGEAPAPELRQVDARRALDSGDLDGAIAALARAVDRTPGDAVSWSDLAALRLERATRLSQPFDAIRALAAATRAVEADPGLSAALFNQALALERLSLPVQASAAWERSLESERDPYWRGEAQSHRQALRLPAGSLLGEAERAKIESAVLRKDSAALLKMVEASPQRFRELLEEDLLVRWAEASGEGRTEDARRAQEIARAVAESLLAVNGERTGADVVAQIDLLAKRGRGRRLSQLVQGLRLYGTGLGLIGKSDFQEAIPMFQNARDLLALDGGAFAGWADYRIAYCHYQRAEYEPARALLRAILNAPDAGAKALRGRSLWLCGLIDLIQGDPAASLPLFGAARESFRQLKETAGVARMSSLLASNYDYLGREDEAWQAIMEALREPEALELPKLRVGIANTASLMAWEHGEPGAALWFQDEVLRCTEDIGSVPVFVEAVRRHASLLGEMGKKGLALFDLEQARDGLRSIPDPRARTILDGDLLLTESELTYADDPQRAVALLDRVLHIFRDSSFHFRIGRALYLRALAARELGLDAEVERDLKAAIEESEQQREKIPALEERASYFDRTKEMINTMVSFQLDRRRQVEAALAYSERGRSRVLLDWILLQDRDFDLKLDPADLQPDTIVSLQQSLPPETVLIETAVLPDRLVLWIVRRSGLQVTTVPVSAAALASLVDKLTSSLLARKQAAFRDASESLYDSLVRPAARFLAPHCRIVFVPDGPLHSLSFALLRDRGTGKYLAQDHASWVSPSARVFTACRRREQAFTQRQRDRVLVITDPDFDREIYPRLPRLKGGEAEREISGLFPGSLLLNGAAATKASFLSQAASYDLVHFGGHSVVSARFPLLSQMVFARDSADPNHGLLYSGDILRMRFQRTRLAVLASCSSASGQVSRTEGVESLARPFLAAGLPSMIGSLWSVDDEATAELFVRFYRKMRQGLDIADALQAAQAEALESGSMRGKDPAVWGGFELIGGGGVGNARVPRVD